MKKCSKCKKIKEFSEFYKRIDRKSDYRSHCKQCISKYDKHYKNLTCKAQIVHRQARTAFERGELSNPIICEICGTIKPLDKHHEDYSKPFEIRWFCRKCHKNRHVLLNNTVQVRAVAW
ncbi:hypothetical protein LCGC14_2516270 [marine sediment metagenome]|uniref:Uncharacterized protein n=1 Tax=marine sediment metagenome TaxID=412755 RepID=A0A0F9BKN0_9ZZZZ